MRSTLEPSRSRRPTIDPLIADIYLNGAHLAVRRIYHQPAVGDLLRPWAGLVVRVTEVVWCMGPACAYEGRHVILRCEAN
jgi:hypothetical protein